MNNITTTMASAVPIYRKQHHLVEKNKLSSFLHLPPTPSSSSITTESYFGINNSEKAAIPSSSLQIPVAGIRGGTNTQYGSLSNSTPYTVSSISRPMTPSQTTISPNDNDEGLYLSWTQQLLREQGFKPSPCQLPDDDGLLNDDDDSSVSGMSSILSSDDDDDEENGEEGEGEEYIAERCKLFSPASRQRPSSFYAYSQRASMISRYSSTAEAAAAVNASLNDSDQGALISNNRGPITTFFHNCFSFCF